MNNQTEARKRRSSLKAMRHGVTGQVIVMPAKDLEAYQDFTQEFFHELKPVGFLEQQLVQFLADTSWRLNRIPALENKIRALDIPTEHPKAHLERARALTVLSMHSVRLTAHFERILQLLSKRRYPPEKKTLPESGFVFSNSRSRYPS